MGSSLFSKKLKHHNIINVLAPKEHLQTHNPDQLVNLSVDEKTLPEKP